MLLKMLQVLEAIQRGHQARAVGRSGGSKLDDGSGVGMHFAWCVQLLQQATPRNRYTEHTNACVSVAPMRWNVLESLESVQNENFCTKNGVVVKLKLRLKIEMQENPRRLDTPRRTSKGLRKFCAPAGRGWIWHELFFRELVF